MKKLLFVFLIFFVGIPLFLLAYLGFVPGLSNILGTNKPRDLGIRWTESDRVSVHQKSGIKFTTLPPETPVEKSIQRSGSHPVKTEFTSAEISATMADRNWRYWPYKDVQMKFNGDGSVEVSGKLIKSRIPNYAAAIGIPKEAADLAMKFLPSDPVFYVKGKAALINNKLTIFDPENLEVGRMPIPLGPILSFVSNPLISPVFAADLQELNSELGNISNKKELIIEFIQERLAAINGFYAKNASFGENKLMFDGNLSDTVSTLP